MTPSTDPARAPVSAVAEFAQHGPVNGIRLDAVTPRAEAAMAYMEQFPFDQLPEEALNLLHLLYSMIEVSFPVEVWFQPRVPDSGATSFDSFTGPRP